MFILQLESALRGTSQGQPTAVKGDATQESPLVFPLACAVQKVKFNSQSEAAENQNCILTAQSRMGENTIWLM